MQLVEEEAASAEAEHHNLGVVAAAVSEVLARVLHEGRQSELWGLHGAESQLAVQPGLLPFGDQSTKMRTQLQPEDQRLSPEDLPISLAGQAMTHQEEQQGCF